MIATTRFQPGDSVYILRHTAVMANKQCPVCRGDGQIFLPIGGDSSRAPYTGRVDDTALTYKEYRCPECNATGTAEYQARTRYTVEAQPQAVVAARVYIAADGCTIVYEFSTGRQREEGEVFGSIREAQVACYGLNNEEQHGC